VKCLGLLALTSEEKCKGVTTLLLLYFFIMLLTFQYLLFNSLSNYFIHLIIIIETFKYRLLFYLELREIIFQVARNEIEEGEIRSQALEALIDMTAVYDQYVLHDNALIQFLLRLQEGAEPALLRVGAEGSAKLLFSGRLSEPKLFANLLKFFFIPELAAQLSVEEEDDERNNTDTHAHHTADDAFLGSSSRLQQVLSIFFQAFFVGGEDRDSIAFLCVSDLVSDLSMLVRDSLLDPSAMSRVRNADISITVVSIFCTVDYFSLHFFHFHLVFFFSLSTLFFCNECLISSSLFDIIPPPQLLYFLLFSYYQITSRLLALCDSIKLPISEAHSAECSLLGNANMSCCYMLDSPSLFC
jgi:Nuclear condensing complex subunits, C-term domain